MSLGDAVRHYRTAKGMTQAQLGIAAGVSPSTVERLEQGKANITVAKLEQIAKELGVSTAQLMGCGEGKTA